MKQKPLFIDFSTQKGGVGKSTFTILAASYLHYQKGLNVTVMDCDYPQCSVHDMRKREIRQLETNLHYQSKAISLFESLGKQTYPIVCSKPEEAISRAEEFLSKESAGYDVVFFDLPGTINNEGVIATFMAMFILNRACSSIPMFCDYQLTWKETTLTYEDMVYHSHTDKTRIFYALQNAHWKWMNYIEDRVSKLYNTTVEELDLSKINTKNIDDATVDLLIDLYSIKKQ